MDEFSDDADDDATRARRMIQIVQGVARQSHSIRTTAWTCEAHYMKPSKKQRLSIYVEPAILKSLAEYAARRDDSLSLVTEAAIASFLSPMRQTAGSCSTKRLDQFDRRMTRMERDLEYQ